MAAFKKTKEVCATKHFEAPKKGDERYRFFGFKIHARPVHGPVLWERGGRVYTERQVREITDNEILPENS